MKPSGPHLPTFSKNNKTLVEEALEGLDYPDISWTQNLESKNEFATPTNPSTTWNSNLFKGNPWMSSTAIPVPIPVINTTRLTSIEKDFENEIFPISDPPVSDPISKIQSSTIPSKELSVTSAVPPISSTNVEVITVIPCHIIQHPKGFSQLKESVSKCSQRIQIGFESEGFGPGKETNSYRPHQHVTKPNATSPVILEEHINWVLIQIDNQPIIYQLMVSSQPTTTIANFFDSTLSKKNSKSTIRQHLALLIQIVQRRLIPNEVELNVFSAQIFLRLLQLSTPRHTPLLYAFETPLYDPAIAAWLWDPEPPDSRSSAGISKSQPFELPVLLQKFVPNHSKFKFNIVWKNLDSSAILKAPIQLIEDHVFSGLLVNTLWNKLKELDMFSAFKFEMSQANLFARMEVHGFAIDMIEMKRSDDEMRGKMNALTTEAQLMFNNPNLMLSSPAQISKTLTESLQLLKQSCSHLGDNPDIFNSTTRAGGYASTRESQLSSLQKTLSQLPVPDDIKSAELLQKCIKFISIVLEYRPISRMQGTLSSLKGLSKKNLVLENSISKDNNDEKRDNINVEYSETLRTVHSRWLQVHTATGRVCSALPSLQQLPIEPGVRSTFTARPGYILVGADYSQIEMRVMAEVTGDPILIEFFKSGLDIHRHVASRIYKVEMDKVTSQQREWCKGIVYGIMYGMGINSLSVSLESTYDEAKQFYQNFLTTFPTLAEWLVKEKELVAKTHQATTLFGRRRLFHPGSESKEQRLGVNTHIQGSAAELVKCAMFKMDETCYFDKLDAFLLTQIHDELIYEVRITQKDQFISVLKRIMEKDAVPSFRTPLKVNIEVGSTWASMEPIDSSKY